MFRMPEGFEPGLFRELIDIVRRFGNPAPEFAAMYLAVKVPRPLLFIVPAVFGKEVVHVFGGHAEVFTREMWMAPLNDDGRHSAHVDSAITADEVLLAKIFIDQVMRGHGGIDAASGERLRVPYALSKRLFSRSVDLVFDDQLPFLPNPHGHYPAAALEAMRGQYDRPDDLCVVTDGFGWAYLSLVSERDDLVAHDAAVQRVCARRGITSWEAFEEVLERDRAALEREIVEETKKAVN